MAEEGVHDSNQDSNEAWIAGALDTFEGPLLAYANRLLGDSDRARDAVQDVFLRLCRQDRTAIDGHLRRWLFTVCRNRALDELRRRKHVKTTELTEVNGRAVPGPTPAQVVEHEEAVSAAVDALARLPEKEREVIHLKFREGLSYRQISAVTGLSLSYVGVLIHTGLRKLRHDLAPALGADISPGTVGLKGASR